MGRTILIIAAVAVIFLILKQMLSQRKTGKPTQKPVDFDAMVRCEHCGTHVPRAQAISRGEEYYCSVAHLSADHPE